VIESFFGYGILYYFLGDNLLKKINMFILTFFLFLVIPTTAVLSQDTGKNNTAAGAVYSLGDQTLSINGGLFVPLFFQ